MVEATDSDCNVAPKANDDADEQGSFTAQAQSLTRFVAILRDEIARADMTLDDLAALRGELKTLEEEVETCRKEIVEEQLDNEINVGDSVAGLTRVEGHNKYLYDADETLETLEEEGIDPLSVCEPKAADVAEALEEEGIGSKDHIGRATYTYYRK
jgi:hypothetical protein